MSVEAITLASQKVIDKPQNILQDQTAKKINNWMITGCVFLAIGAIGVLVAAGGCSGFFAFVPSTLSKIIIAIAATSTFVGVSSLFGGYCKKKYSIPDCNPRDFGIAGIMNTNNNCWLNSLLQVVLNDNDLHKALKNDKTFGKFIDEYVQAVKDGKNPDSQPLRKYLRTKFQSITSSGGFQDSHEHLTVILDLLREKSPNLQNEMLTRYHFEYPSSGKKEVLNKKEANNGIINLPLPTKSGKFTVTSLFSEYCNSEQKTKVNITQTNEKIIQDKTGVLGFFGISRNKVVKETVVVGEKTLVLEERKLAFAPNSLFFNVQRYLSNQNVDAPSVLTLGKKYFENNQSAKYSLDGFIVNLNQIHYISYVKKNGIWFMCDDNDVQPISESTFEEDVKKAYILHYKKL